MSVVTPTGSRLFKFLKPGMRPHAIDFQAAAMWGVAAGTTALWIVQGGRMINESMMAK